MQITFLGTSAGQPTRARHMSAIALNLKGKRDWFLVDCAEASQHQLLRLPLSLLKLRAIFITHLHGDHCYGLPGVLASAQLSGRIEPLMLCGPKGLKEYIQALRDHTSLHLEYPLDIIEVSEGSDLWRGYGVQVTATKLSHTKMVLKSFFQSSVISYKCILIKHPHAFAIFERPIYN